MKKTLLFLCVLLLTTVGAQAQRINVGAMLMPQQSMYNYSNAYAPKQTFRPGMATGISVAYNLPSGYYGIEAQALYSFEKHAFKLPIETDFTGTTNYVKIALLNNFYSFSQTARCRLVTGIGAQISRLTQANALMAATDKIVSYYDTAAKTDFSAVGKIGLAISIKETLLGFGARYERGFKDITGSPAGSVYNHALGFYITAASR